MRDRNIFLRAVLPFLTFLAIPIINLLNIPNPAIIFMLMVVYFSFIGGIVSGGISALLTIVYSAWFFSDAGSFFRFNSENLKKFLLILITMPVTVLMVGRLKDKLKEKTTQLEKKMAEYNDQIRLAGTVQRYIQKGDYADEAVIVRTIYQPAQAVSGDSYYYHWRLENQIFNGFILDVTGHGVPTALQTAGIRVIMEQELENEICSQATLERLNERIESYLIEASFAAVVLFSFDFRTRILTVVSGGINYFLTQQNHSSSWITIPGSYLGISPKAEFGIVHISFEQGDSFYFLTDGIVDQMDMSVPLKEGKFEETVAQLEIIAKRSERRDDCSALCIKVVK